MLRPLQIILDQEELRYGRNPIYSSLGLLISEFLVNFQISF